jgi:RNA polymerase sigma-B factor
MQTHDTSAHRPQPPHPRGGSRTQDARALVVRAQQDGTPVARARAVEALMPLARSLARRYHRGVEPLEDLEQVACIGLLKAIDGFDADRGTSFTAYAVPTIVGELRRHFRDKGWTVRVPRDLQELALRVAKVGEQVSGQLGRAPTPAELAAHLGEPVERILEARELGHAMRPASLDRPRRDDLDGQGESVIDGLGTEDAGYDRTDASLTARELLARLPDRERQIIELRFMGELSQQKIADQLGISQMHVSRLLRRTLADLGEMAREGGARLA